MRISRKVVSLTLAAMLIAGSVAAQETPASQPLTPVQRRALQTFNADGILEGTSCSIADCSGSVQRWEVAMWIIRLFNYDPMPHESFADVDSEQPYADFVEALYEEDITTGCLFDPLRFCPERPTSRGQMAAFVTRAFGLDDTDPPHGFFDVPSTHVFGDNITTLQNTGILFADCDDGERLFCPWQPIVAAEAVEWLYRASLLVYDIDGELIGGGGGGSGGGGSGGGGSGGGGGGGGGSGGGGDDSSGSSNPPTTTLPPFIPTLVGNEDIDLVDGECTHHDQHNQGGDTDKKSYMILDGTYPVVLVFDDNGPYAARSGHDEFFQYDDLTPTEKMSVTHRYRVERNTIRDVYFSHWHDGEVLHWVYWIPETVLEPREDSIAGLIAGEVLFLEDGSGTEYRRLRNERGGLSYGPFAVAPACNAHSHPPPTGNYVP